MATGSASVDCEAAVPPPRRGGVSSCYRLATVGWITPHWDGGALRPLLRCCRCFRRQPDDVGPGGGGAGRYGYRTMTVIFM
jgi:hypothetical protein